VALALAALMPLAPLGAQNQAQRTGQPLYQFKATTELVLVNVVVRDKSGGVRRDLKREDFTILEDGKPQKISTFDFENIETAPGEGPSQATLLVAAAPDTKAAQPVAAATEDFRDRRLIVLFFDLSSMQPDETEHAVQAAQKFLDKQMTPADLIAVVTLASQLQVEQDFTSDRAQLTAALTRLNPASGQGFEEGPTGDTEGTPDTGGSFTADDTEFNIFNTDRRLDALQAISQTLARVQQKKSVIYFSSGMNRTGLENQTALRAAVNAAIRANVSIYTMDMRGLQAMVAGGEASQASLRGTSPYSGASVRGQFDSNFSSQETLSTVAEDTGGKAFLDSNDFSGVFNKVQEDTAAYYLLGYKSSNPARDGRYRRIEVKADLPGVKVEHRSGYYAPKDFTHFTRDDREQQIVDEMTSELPSTDLSVFLSAAYFRMDENKYYVPVSLVVPGSEIPFTRASDKDKATLDIAGLIRDQNNRAVGNVRDTIKLAVEETQDVRRKHVQYNTGFILGPGRYHVKFVVRENQTGRIGSFEADITVPDLKRAPVKVSSVVVGAQINPSARRRGPNPLVRDTGELIPRVTNVFSADQHLYFYYEVYEPAREKEATGKPGIRVLTSIQFFNGKVKTYETPLVEAKELNAPERKAAVFQFDVPLSQLRPGFYTCQVNVIDDAAGTFAFPRLPVLVRK
jgi:VWFA-related protein